jgi:hypothetical protein
METNLRPLSLGEILDRTAQLYRSNFLLFAGISSFYAGVIMVLSLLQLGAQQVATTLHSPRGTIWVTVIGIMVLWLAIFAFGGISVAANNRAVGWVHLGQPATIGSAYSSVLAKAGRYLWLMTITYFIVFLPCVLLYAGYAVLIFVYVRPKGLLAQHGAAAADPQALLVFGVATIVFLLLLLGAVAYAIVMALRYSLAVPACVVENLKARAAIRRSIQLSKGSRGRIFMLGLLATIIQVGLTLITQGFFLVAGFKHHGVLPVWAQVSQQIVAFFTNTFVGPIYATGLTLFYYDQRVRKEGYDIEWMMQAAGMTQSATQVAADTGPEAIATPEPENLHG